MVFFITTVAFVQTLVVLYLLPLRGSESRAYPYIRALLLSLILHLGIKLYLLGVLHDEFLFGRLSSFTSFSYGPLLLFQFRQSIGRPLRRSAQLLHLIPFLVAFGLYLYCVVTLLPMHQLNLFKTIFSAYSWSVLTSWVIYFGYLLWAVRRAMFRQQADRQLIGQISGLFLVAYAGGKLFKFIADQLAINYEVHTFPYLVFGLISFLCLRFFFRQSPVDAATPATAPPAMSPSNATADMAQRVLVVEPEKEVGAYGKSGLLSEQIETYWRAMETLMQRDKPYVDPNLSLDDLAERLNISRQHVSQVLNQRAEKNFYAYVNEYRVWEMLRLMKQKPGGRILEMAFQVGFQSKTTLNAYFRKVTGHSPTQYQQALMGRQAESLHP